jgi:hypothetical protein
LPAPVAKPYARGAFWAFRIFGLAAKTASRAEGAARNVPMRMLQILRKVTERGALFALVDDDCQLRALSPAQIGNPASD